LDGAGKSLALVGGANMGGKTTLLRCTALGFRKIDENSFFADCKPF
jgi:ABC-type cobalamin/Fe3+-siderophores transport system ATPase subunit